MSTLALELFCVISLWTIVVISQGHVSANRDIGCNYLNLGGIAMPIDYCMEAIFDTFEYGMKFVCNETWDGVTLQMFSDIQCDGGVIYSEPQSNGLVLIPYQNIYKKNNICILIYKQRI